jgi:hypothetical protein
MSCRLRCHSFASEAKLLLGNHRHSLCRKICSKLTNCQETNEQHDDLENGCKFDRTLHRQVSQPVITLMKVIFIFKWKKDCLLPNTMRISLVQTLRAKSDKKATVCVRRILAEWRICRWNRSVSRS